jgi:molybdenum cofactor biosynthesis enzyme MoaA
MIINRDRVKRIFQSNNIKIVDITIILDNICNADCPLCVAKHVIINDSCKENCEVYQTECLRCCDREAEDAQFFAAVEDILSTVNGGNVRITLSGGEPTLSNRLIPILKILDKFTFMSLNIETNGAGLLEDIIAEELLKRMVNIILSRFGITDGENDAKFNFSYSRVTKADSETIIKRYNGLVTLNCILLKGCVENAKKLIEYYEYFKGLGAKNIIFTEAIFDTTLAESNQGIYEYYLVNKVPIADISRDLDSLGYAKHKDNNGAFRTIIHNYKGNIIVLTATDVSRIAKENTNNNYYSKYLIYPTGETGTVTYETR